MKYRTTLLSIIAISYTFAFFGFGAWKTTMNNGDSSGYYMHLVSSFINHDVGDYNKTIDDYLNTYPSAKNPKEDKFGIRKTKKEKYYIKYTLGVAVMEIPALLIAHSIASISNAYPNNGWSLPYSICINFSKIIYILFGFLFLMKTLQNYFENKVVFATVLTIALASNLFYHGIFLSLSHSFLFFDFCLLIYLSDRFYKKPTIWKAFGIGALLGLITLTRVPEVIGFLIPLLWGIRSKEDFKTRAGLFKAKSSFLVFAFAGLCLVFSPQLFYWKYVSGEWFFNPYQGENFNFLKPNIINGWFNFRNGWLIYSPVMILSLIGFFYLRKGKPSDAFFPAFLFTLFIAWIHYSYYVWNYYPGMGSRIMIECYPILSFPLAACITYFLKGRISSWIVMIAITLFSMLNIFQCWQMNQGIIYTQNGSAAFYKETFAKTDNTRTALQCYDVKRAQPRLDDLIFIDTLLYNDFENSNETNTSKELKFSGTQSIISSPTISAETSIDISKTKIKAYDWVYVGIKAYRKQTDMVWNREVLEELFCVLEDENGKKVKSSKIKIAAHIGNEDNGIFHVGTSNIWDEAGFYFRISNKLKESWRLKIYVRNLNGHKLYLDDLVLVHYREN